MGNYVIDTRTTWTRPEAARAIAVGYLAIRGRLPSVATLALLCAQWAGETGWGRSCHCHNPGNAKAVLATWRGDYTAFGCWELLHGKKVWLHPSPSREWPGRARHMASHPTSVESDAACLWRAFDSAEEGATDWLALLASRAHWLTAAETGDVATFARALKAGGYYTATETSYRDLMAGIVRAWPSVAAEALATIGVARIPVAPSDPPPMRAHCLDDEWLRSVGESMALDWTELGKSVKVSVESMNDG